MNGRAGFCPVCGAPREYMRVVEWMLDGREADYTRIVCSKDAKHEPVSVDRGELEHRLAELERLVADICEANSLWNGR